MDVLFRDALFCVHSVHKTRHFVLTIGTRGLYTPARHDLPIFLSPNGFCKAIKSSAISGLWVRERERVVFTWLNPTQFDCFVGESGVKPTLEGGVRGELLDGVGLTVFFNEGIRPAYIIGTL